MKKPELTDEDKAVLEQMKRRREENRRKRAEAGPSPKAAAAAQSIAGKWSESFLGSEEEEGAFEGLPEGTPSGIVVIRGPAGVSLYRDGRCGFSVAIPGHPRFVAPGAEIDASCRLRDVPITLHACKLDPHPGASLADAVTALASDITAGSAEPLELGLRGVEAAAVATRRHDGGVREVTVLAGGPDDGTRAILILMLDAEASAVDAATLATVRGAVIGSAGFVRPARRAIPPLLPESPWLEAGLPLRLRADAPALPEVQDGAAVAERLLAAGGRLPPERPLDEVTRARIADALAGASPELREAASRLSTVHDLRGLALALSA
jgi:hypothetical protein